MSTTTTTKPMNLAETYFLASKARTKLAREAGRHDLNLRVLVSHANMLDNLMEALTTKKRTPATAVVVEEPRVAAPAPPVQASAPAFASIQEEDEDDYEEDYSEDDDVEFADEDEELEAFEETKHVIEVVPILKVTPNVHAHEIQVTEISDSDCDSEDDDEDSYGNSYISTSVSSGESESLPSLSYSSEEESDDEFDSQPRRSVIEVARAVASSKPQHPSLVLNEAELVAAWFIFTLQHHFTMYIYWPW